MNLFSSAELSRMRAAQSGSLQDEFFLRRVTTSLDDFGQEVSVFEDLGPFECGVNLSSSDETIHADGTSVQIDATLRVTLETALLISPLDRVIISKRFGEAIDPLEFSIDGIPLRGPTGSVLRLVRVE